MCTICTICCNLSFNVFAAKLQDTADSCISHSTWDTKFNACLRIIVGKEQNRTSSRGESFLYIYTIWYICQCKWCKECNSCSICPWTRVMSRVGDGSWCSHVDDDSTWAASLIDVVLLVRNANTLLVEREMPVWVTQRIYELCTIRTICKLYTICKLCIPIDPRDSKLHMYEYIHYESIHYGFWIAIVKIQLRIRICPPCGALLDFGNWIAEDAAPSVDICLEVTGITRCVQSLMNAVSFSHISQN